MVIRSAVEPKNEHVIDITREAARWSLKSLSQTHEKIRIIKDEFLTTADAGQKASLEELFAPAGKEKAK